LSATSKRMTSPSTKNSGCTCEDGNTPGDGRRVTGEGRSRHSIASSGPRRRPNSARVCRGGLPDVPASPPESAAAPPCSAA
jgi:hypothetical protein